MSQWLKHTEAAAALAVDVRTIKRWMKCPAKRAALGAVRHGEQWRIPRPAEIWHWDVGARRNLKDLGVELKASWERDLEKLGKESARYELESLRLWLAAYIKALQRDNITQAARDEILLLLHAGRELLSKQPSGTEMSRLKSAFPGQLRAQGFSEGRIRTIMSYWPNESHFRRVRAAHTLKQLEAIRRGVDVAQAANKCEQQRNTPTAENLRPLFHKNTMEHMNDTPENLPGIVVKNPTPEELRRLTMASVCDQSQGKQPPRVSIDFRQPQKGLALRTFRKRHPLRKPPQRGIIAAVYGARDSIPGANETPHGGKTPVRGSKTSQEGS